MKLLTFVHEGKYRLGVHTPEGILDVSSAQSALSAGAESFTTTDSVLNGGTQALQRLQQLVEQALGSGDKGAWLLDESALQLGPAVTNPGKIICVGLNYRRHAEETNSPIPQSPILFSKFNNALAAHGDEVPLPVASEKVDYEAELAIVIGKRAKHVAKEDALQYAAGYCSANDLSARDLQLRTPQWLLGKSCDKFAPLGPYLVTADEVGNPNDLAIGCTVNGEQRQSSNTSDMIFHCDEIISYISRHMTLEPGDIILTGTPEGVVLGYPAEKQVYLQPGDVVTIEIEKLGRLTNKMIAE
ncbi:fumarylacetoacetate hydrolase family protein [Paenibacillus sp. J5C_2022]|uniref:fumarylacetoacetate hydrolase family protein n=1 Tax=Paenibacillus sp. J5C2022 TaxID=2977129 RepID=UPI0021D38506|nr:fumarylacetoacetate hydrolase family protein [Paenibacillus sp. J5C2022]MCU6712622.1 fumarylacetoacetate hydrolase family protein [Paenibacillus sp. J5C2022]